MEDFTFWTWCWWQVRFFALAFVVVAGLYSLGVAIYYLLKPLVKRARPVGTVRVNMRADIKGLDALKRAGQKMEEIQAAQGWVRCPDCDGFTGNPAAFKGQAGGAYYCAECAALFRPDGGAHMGDKMRAASFLRAEKERKRAGGANAGGV